MSKKYIMVKEMFALISEYHWYGNDTSDLNLYVMIDHYQMSDFMCLFKEYPTLFDDEGVEMRWKGNYVCIPNFEDVLGYIGWDIDEIKAFFDKEPWK